jgi:hypothetical protein
MDNSKLVGDEWGAVATLLPGDLSATAREFGASLRWREVPDGEVLLHLALAYGLCGMSLRSVARWARESGVARLSDVALLKRLRACGPWLGKLVNEKLGMRRGVDCAMRVLLVDATTVSRPGSKGTDFRVHLAFDAAEMQMSSVEVTDASGGEGFDRSGARKGDLAIADRGYANRRGICFLSGAEAFCLVRLTANGVPMTHASGKRVNMAAVADSLAVGEVLELPVWTVPVPRDGYPKVEGRLIALRKTDEATEAARRKLHAEAKRRGQVPSAEALAVAACVFLFTTLPEDRVDAAAILELYRFRWQIELAFKRLKSVMELDEMAAKDDALCRTFILAKILGALLVEEMTRAFSPWGYGVPRTHKRLSASERSLEHP